MISASGEKLGGRLPRDAEFVSLPGTFEFGVGGADFEVKKADGVIFTGEGERKKAKRTKAAAFWK